MDECDYCFQKAFIIVSDNPNIESGNYCENCFIKNNFEFFNNISQKENPIIIIDKNQCYIFILYKDKISPYLLNNKNSFLHETYFNDFYSQSSEKIHFNYHNYNEHIDKIISKYKVFDKIILIKNNKTSFLTKDDLKIYFPYL